MMGLVVLGDAHELSETAAHWAQTADRFRSQSGLQSRNDRSLGPGGAFAESLLAAALRRSVLCSDAGCIAQK